MEQGRGDTSTMDGRAMFGMLLAELQRELIVANTNDGLAAARARGRVGGRRPKLTQRQLDQAQRMYDQGDHTAGGLPGHRPIQDRRRQPLPRRDRRGRNRPTGSRPQMVAHRLPDL
jgi:hypothetical protein